MLVIIAIEKDIGFQSVENQTEGKEISEKETVETIEIIEGMRETEVNLVRKTTKKSLFLKKAVILILLENHQNRILQIKINFIIF